MSSKEIAAKGQKYVMNTYGRYPIAPVKGKGSYLWDADGKEYLDFVGGIAVCILGHSHPELNQALMEQSQKLWHVSNLYWIEPQVEAAEKLALESGLDKVFFCNSGAEANEAAIKLARKYFYRRGQSEKHEIITFKNSFHGRTLAAITATGQSKYQEGFAPLPGGFAYAEYNNLDSVKAMINEHTCAVLAEPVQGEGGIKPAAPAFLEGLRKLCDEAGILLIFDEVQCGMGRTGQLFAYQHYGIKPDIVTLAKGLGGGFPIGAMIAAEEAASGFAPGDHASTFGGNPLATAMARKVLEIVCAPEFQAQVQQSAHYLEQELRKIEDHRLVEVRGRGLMMGIEFNAEVKELINICLQKGLLLVGAGHNVVRFVPPLTVNEGEIDQAAALLKQALKEWNE